MKLKATIFVILLAMLVLDQVESGWFRRGWRKIKRGTKKVWRKAKHVAKKVWKKAKKSLTGAAKKWAIAKLQSFAGDMKKLQEKDQASYDEIMENLHQMIADETNIEFATDFAKELEEFVNMDEDERFFKLKNEIFSNDNQSEYEEDDVLVE
uniref:uncharacterized protein LOC120327039 n=1 Tax=Styela clava TaxID=7725 RepID=UPI00193AB2B2|nr:uncharacterized protein LOC120327039 [Styela clava]